MIETLIYKLKRRLSGEQVETIRTVYQDKTINTTHHKSCSDIKTYLKHMLCLGKHDKKSLYNI